MLSWFAKIWAKFEAWVAKIAPGVKTELVAFLGMISSLAAAGQEYLTNMPVTKFITAEQISIVAFVLFTLAFWLRGIGTRAQVASSA